MSGALHSQPLWTAAEALAATGGRASSGKDWRAAGVSIDSRSCAAGDLFVALAGPNFDGHDYVAAALGRGAAAAIVSRRPANVPADAALVLVDDTMTALDDLGRCARRRTGAQIVAITGSVGKTSTKEGLAHALSVFGPTHATSGNLNNQWGVPLSLARMPRASRFGVFELGMNHAGELTPLSRLTRPDVAIVTTIAAAHLEFFDSVGAIAEAKAEIFAGMTPTGTAILNRDNPWFATLAEAAWARGIETVVGFGEHAEANVRLDRYQPTPEGCDVGAMIAGQNLRYRLAMRGRHAALNSLAILAAVDALGADIVVAAAALATLQPPKGRGQRLDIAGPNGAFALLDDSYNASPASIRAAIEVLASTPLPGDGRRIAVLGDMLELGPDAARLHAGLAAVLVDAGIDLVFAAGANMAHLYDALPPAMRGGHAATSAELLPAVSARIGGGDVVLVKGSLGSRMALIVDALTQAGEPHANGGTRHAGRGRTACAG
jgi:UDP-N-acetylmuramoyl-tripeptide--D-alanyl-D-alanine ligase